MQSPVRIFFFVLFLLPCFRMEAQPLKDPWNAENLTLHQDVKLPELSGLSGLKWMPDGHSFTRLVKDGNTYKIVEGNPDSEEREKTIVDAKDLIPENSSVALKIEDYTWYPEKQKLLLFTDSKRVWRAKTKGEYWLYDVGNKTLKKLGADLPASSLQFAKLAPDGEKVAYVSGHNLYIESVKDGKITRLTQDGTETLINGTFDWAYEEELFCRDGFRWSPDSKSLAYWQIDASGIGNYYMLNTTDSVYSKTIPVQYPKVGYDPSPAKIGIIHLASGETEWLDIPGDPIKNYLVRMEWDAPGKKIMIQQMNRKQDTSRLYLIAPEEGEVKKIYEDTDSAWIDLSHFWNYDQPGWTWVDGGSFLWLDEQDGWRHIYLRNDEGTEDRCLTSGDFDVIELAGIDREKKVFYYYASPENATRQYLYKQNLSGKGKPVLISDRNEKGTHEYDISPDGRWAVHRFSNHKTPETVRLTDLRSSKTIKEEKSEIPTEYLAQMLHHPMDFFQVEVSHGFVMDGWMIRPADFDSTKKYPVLFYVYGEPAGATVKDRFAPNGWYQSLADKGYVIISIDNPGTPAPKGRRWRKAIFKKIGVGNVEFLAEAAKKILEWSWIDEGRAAVWGWSGGGSSTQNLLFRHPDLFQTGMAVAGVSNLLFYDNIYEERYMGLLPEDLKYYQKGSSVNYAKGLKGNLLLIHGSGDDNVHYQNQEALINALVEAGKSFRMMEYPNRTHGINEGKGTSEHLYALLTDFLIQNCEPGAK